MNLTANHHTLANESVRQQRLGEIYRFSESLNHDFVVNPEQRYQLARLARGNTLFVLNWIWPKCTNLVLPDSYDTYVFLQYQEPIDWSWFDNFASSHKLQKIILLAPVQSSATLCENFSVIEHQRWAHHVSRALVAYGSDYQLSWPRRYRISSFCNKPSFFKTLSTAYLHKFYADRVDMVLSWNQNVSQERCASMDSMDHTYMQSTVEILRKYYHDHLKHLIIAQEPFENSIYENHNWRSSRGFTDTLINFTNETYSPSFQNGRLYPGPFFTDKTRKALLAGCAIVPVGMMNSYQQLERFGFICEYPWNKNFDCIPGDLDRIEQVFDVMDHVMQADYDTLQESLRPIIEHNFYYIRSQSYLDHMQSINEQAVTEYLTDHV